MYRFQLKMAKFRIVLLWRKYKKRCRVSTSNFYLKNVRLTLTFLLNQKYLGQHYYKEAYKIVLRVLEYSMIQNLFRRLTDTVRFIQKRTRIYLKGREIQKKTVKNMLLTELENLKKTFQSQTIKDPIKNIRSMKKSKN